MNFPVFAFVGVVDAGVVEAGADVDVDVAVDTGRVGSGKGRKGAFASLQCRVPSCTRRATVPGNW